MAKRSTIGENPLDAVTQEHPLNTVVPDLSSVNRGGRGQSAPEIPPAVQERLKGLEAGLQGLRTEVAGLRAAPEKRPPSRPPSPHRRENWPDCAGRSRRSRPRPQPLRLSRQN